MDLVSPAPLPPASPLRAAIRARCRIDEAEAVAGILAAPRPGRDARPDRRQSARAWSPRCAANASAKAGIDAFLHEYTLSSPGGRGADVPRRGAAAHARRGDRRPADPRQDRRRRIGSAISASPDRSSSTPRPGRLMLTGRLLRAEPAEHDSRGALRRFVARSGEPVCAPGGDRGDAHPRPPVRDRAHDRGGARTRPRAERHGYRHSYDMLGEAARTAADAARYFAAYERRDRARSARRRPAGTVDRGAGHFGQAVGAAPALRDGAARAGLARDAAAACSTLARPRAAGRDRLHDRCRGSRPPRAVARPRRERWRSPRSSPAGTGSASRCRPTRSGRRR